MPTVAVPWIRHHSSRSSVMLRWNRSSGSPAGLVTKHSTSRRTNAAAMSSRSLRIWYHFRRKPRRACGWTRARRVEHRFHAGGALRQHQRDVDLARCRSIEHLTPERRRLDDGDLVAAAVAVPERDRGVRRCAVLVDDEDHRDVGGRCRRRHGANVGARDERRRRRRSGSGPRRADGNPTEFLRGGGIIRLRAALAMFDEHRT